MIARPPVALLCCPISPNVSCTLQEFQSTTVEDDQADSVARRRYHQKSAEDAAYADCFPSSVQGGHGPPGCMTVPCPNLPVRG